MEQQVPSAERMDHLIGNVQSSHVEDCFHDLDLIIFDYIICFQSHILVHPSVLLYYSFVKKDLMSFHYRSFEDVLNFAPSRLVL